MKKVLFLSNMLPNNMDAGGILYADIIKEYGKDKFAFISLMYKLKEKDVNLDIMDQVISQFSFRIPKKNLFYKILSKLPLIDHIFLFFNLLLYKNKIIKSIESENFDAIFAPLRGDVLLLLPSILKKINLPLYAMVEDTVEAEIDEFWLVYKIKMKNYYDLLKSVIRLGVAGETMHQFIKASFNIESIILRPSFEKFSKAHPKILDNEFNIFFAGNTYAENELKVFIKALEHFASTSTITLKFYLASHRSYSSKSQKLQIVNLGWIQQEKLIEYMEKCHIAYLPYRSEPKFMHQMKYAFPGKSGLYISNNLPIFFHGPSYSSFNTFLTNYRVGISCDSLDPIILSNKIIQFITDASFYLTCQEECQKAFVTEYDKKVFSKRVMSFLRK